MTEFLETWNVLKCCCFSPDGKSIATIIDKSIQIWDTTNLGLYPIEILAGPIVSINSIVFSLSLISVTPYKIQFWQIRASSTHSAVTSPISIPLTSAPVTSITLQVEDGIAISSHSDGVVKTWDLSTGLCRTSFQTPAHSPSNGDTADQ